MMSLDIKDIHMNIFDNIFSGSNGIANKLIDIFGTEAYYVRFNNDKTYDPKTDTYTNIEEIRKLITITPPSKYKSYELQITINTLKRFLFQKKITSRGKLIIKICKIHISVAFLTFGC